MEGRDRNQAFPSGFDLINHAIRMGAVGEMLGLRNSELLMHLNGSGSSFLGRPTEIPGPAQGLQSVQPPSTSSYVQSTMQQQAATDRINPNAFQFPWKLHDMLDNAAEEGVEHIVSWQDQGRSFRVHKPQKFVELVMCRYFKQTKYKSFQRQLNLYGFSRLNEGPAKGGYHHKYFIRGQRTLCQLITRSSTADAPQADATSSTSEQNGSHKEAASPSLTSRKVEGTSLAPTKSEDLSVGLSRQTPLSTSPAIATVSSASSSTTNTTTSIGELRLPKKDDPSVPTKSTEDPYKVLLHKEFQFPWKLHEMLERSTVDNFEHVVSWQPGDFCFKVHDPPTFVKKIMPCFFKQTKYKSFQRQLNLYGFVRIDDGPNKGAYRHKLFVKGKKDLLNSMTRQKIKGQGDQAPSKGDQGDRVEADIPRSNSGQHVGLTPFSQMTSGIPAILAAIECTEGADIPKNNFSGSTSPAKSQVSPDGLSWRQKPSESFSDWMIEVIRRDTNEKDVYHVHRRVLAVGPKRSEYFVRLFKTDASNKSVLELTDSEAEVFPLILDHMYTDSTLQLDAARAYVLYRLAEFLEVTSVLQAVTEFYTKNMNRENVIDFLTVAESFRNKTLLLAAVERFADEVGSMDIETVKKINPPVFLEVLLRNKQMLSTQRCDPGRLSQLVAACIESQPEKATREVFLHLTAKELLPYVEPTAAVRLLAIESTLFQGTAGSGDDSLRTRCVPSITQSWFEIRKKLQSDFELANRMKAISSAILYDILMITAQSN